MVTYSGRLADGEVLHLVEHALGTESVMIHVMHNIGNTSGDGEEHWDACLNAVLAVIDANHVSVMIGDPERQHEIVIIA